MPPTTLRSLFLLLIFTILLSLAGLGRAVAAKTEPGSVAPSRSWEVTLTVMRALDLLPHARLPYPAPMADQTPQPEATFRPVREANDADTIQTLYRRRSLAGVQIAGLTGSVAAAPFIGPMPDYLSDTPDLLAMPSEAGRLNLPRLSPDPKLLDTLQRQIILKLAIVLYRQDLGRYPEGLDALVAGRKNYFEGVARLFPAGSPYAVMAETARAARQVSSPKGLEWVYNVAPNGGAYVLGLRRGAIPGRGISSRQPLVGSQQGTGELPLLPGPTAEALLKSYRQYAAEHPNKQ